MASISARQFFGRYGVALLLLIIADQLSKWRVVGLFEEGQGIIVTSFFNLVRVHNHGAAFSFLAQYPTQARYFFSLLAVVISLFLLRWLWRERQDKRLAWPLVMIISGALGNLIDRLYYGYVVDFLDLHLNGWHWPAFNLADSLICVGAVLLIWADWRRPK